MPTAPLAVSVTEVPAPAQTALVDAVIELGFAGGGATQVKAIEKAEFDP